MDHLPCVSHPTADFKSNVPYICLKPYDGGPFLTYPRRVDKAYVLPDPSPNSSRLPFWQQEKLHPTPNRDFEDFCQTWLFFGLVNELLGDLCPAEELICSDESGVRKTLTTSTLLDKVQSWGKSLKNNKDLRQYDHTAECLRLTHSTLRAVSEHFWIIFNNIARAPRPI